MAPPGREGGAGDGACSQSAGEEHRELALRVRAKQREGEVGRLQWLLHCEAQGATLRDPRRLPVALLQGFLRALEEGELPQDVEVLRSSLREAPPPLRQRAARAAVVLEDEVEGAKARAACGEDAHALCQLLPASWRHLYEAPARLTYDAREFDFLSLVRVVLDCPPELPLCRLHEAQRPEGYEPCPALRQGLLLAGRAPAPEAAAGKSNNRSKRDWKTSPLYGRLLELYSRFLREEVLPALGAAAGSDDLLDAVVQASPVLRVVMPSANIATVPHRDCEYGHIAEELNFWLPLTPVWGSNSLHAESFPGRGDFSAFEGDVGDVFRWWGNRCSHYAEANTTGSTRVSLDFRLVPRRFWDAAEAAGVRAAAAERWTRWHGGSLSLGSYYWEERATALASAGAGGLCGAMSGGAGVAPRACVEEGAGGRSQA